MRFVLFICSFLIHNLAFALELGGVAGEVRGLDGKPAAGVRVAVAFVDQSVDGIRAPVRSSQFAAITDALGRYRVTNITPGRHFLIAGRIDQPTFYPGTKDASEAQLVTIPSGSVIEGLNFQLVQHPGVKLSSRIVADGVPIPKEIALFANAPFWFREDVAVEEDGSFTFHSLPPDSYDLSTFPDAFLWNAASVVVRNKDVTGIRIVATPLVQLNGWVEVEGGSAVPRIQLEVKGKPGKGAAGVSVDYDTGVFYMSLSVGEYRIAVRNLPKDYRVASFKYGNTDLLRSAIRVVGGVQRFTLKLAPAQPSKMRRIRGRITGVENIATSAEVTLYGNSLLIPLRAPIDDEGSFAFTHITSGTYTLEAGSERKTLIVGNADIENADVFVPARRYLTGRVVVADGGQAPRIDIAFVRDAMVTYPGSRSPGTIEGSLADGEYRIRVSGFRTEV